MWPALLQVEEILKYRSIDVAEEEIEEDQEGDQDAADGGIAEEIEVEVEEPIHAHFQNLPVGTHCARRSTHLTALNDNREGVPPFFGWFTYVLNADNVAAAAREDYFEIKLTGYTTQHDDEGNSTNQPTKLFRYQLQQGLTLYNMSEPDTIRSLQQQLSHTNYLDRSFRIVDGQVVRSSDFNTDRNLFIQLVNEGLVHHEVQGWLHDDMSHWLHDESVVGGIHRREAVVLNPRIVLLPPVAENDGYTTP